jgi:hypothetical protein
VVYRHQTDYDSQVKTPVQLAQRLRRDGFTHLLVAESDGQRGIRYQDTLSRLVDQAEELRTRQPLFLTLTEYEFADTDGASRRYRLLMLR